MNERAARASSEEARWTQAMLGSLRDVARQDRPAEVSVIVEELLLDWFGDRATCLYHDPDGGVLWSAVDDGPQGDVATGLAGHAARTGQAVCVARATRDPRYDRALDDREGNARDRLLIQPVERDGTVHAVLVVGRGAAAAEFDARDRERIGALARHLGPLLEQLALRIEADEGEAREEVGPATPYRAEALEAHERFQSLGELVALESGWLRWCYRLLVGSFLLGLAYLASARVGDRAIGPALVRLGSRIEVRAIEGGSVAEVLVASGDPVGRGDPLIRLDSAADDAEARRLAFERELQLRNLLREPGDRQAQQAITSIRAQQAQVEVRRREHVILAPRDGVVQDLRASPGQAVRPGDVLVALGGGQGRASVLALLPGDQRPRLALGMPLEFRIEGYPDAALTLRVDRVSEDVIGPGEAVRLLGPAVAEDLGLDGPVTLAEAALPDDFASGTSRYRYHDGMRGRAEVQVRWIRLAVALIPGLEALWE